jgi:hypothetical protein
LENFSFRHTDIHNILSRAYSLVPGISKVMSISCPDDGSHPEVYYIDAPTTKSTLEELPPDEKVLARIIALQSEKMKFTWYSEDEMPFSIEKPKIKSLEVFDEFEKNILMLSVPSESGKLNDLYFFYFNENLSNFTITQAHKQLNQENKQIVGSLLFNSITTILDILRKDKIAFNSFKSSVNHIIADMESAQATINSFREKHNDVLLNYTREVIHEHSDSFDDLTFELTTNAIKKIKKFDGDLTTLKDALKQAMLFASSLSIGDKTRQILVDDFHLNFTEIKSPEPKQIPHIPESRQTKVYSWLDELEEAVHKVYKQKEPIISANVGPALKKPITAPAITDKIRNHQKTIRILMMDHPDRWTLAKSEFKPLLNILTSNYSSDDENIRKNA